MSTTFIYEDHCERYIDCPQAFGCLAYARADFIVCYACDFGVEHLHASRVVQQGHNRECEQDDSHAADPLHQGSPQVDSMAHSVDAGKDGCAGGGESGYGFEECVGYSYGSGAQHEGEQSEQRQHYPDGGREQVAVAFSHVCVFGARCVCGQKSCQKCDSRGDGECLPVCFVVYQACGHGKQKEGGFYAQQPSDDALDHW